MPGLAVPGLHRLNGPVNLAKIVCEILLSFVHLFMREQLERKKTNQIQFHSYFGLLAGVQRAKCLF
jgi:hypothetical protein